MREVFFLVPGADVYIDFLPSRELNKNNLPIGYKVRMEK
jgi:hypothetical protein